MMEMTEKKTRGLGAEKYFKSKFWEKAKEEQEREDKACKSGTA